MNCRRYLALIVLVGAGSSLRAAESAEKPVVLDPYQVNSYLENYASGSSYSALRTNAPLMEIPLSTSVITSGLLLDQGLTDVNEAVRNIAGAQAVQGGAEFQNYYFTRGMPNFYYRDGIRMDLAGGNITANVAGLENIEVLKGPSSILYGRGTPGGIVNFNSKRPLFQQRQSLEATYGANEHYRGDLDVTGPAGQSAAYRLIATIDDADSYRDGVSHTTRYLNPAATFNFDKQNQLMVLVDYADQEFTPDGGIAVRPNGARPRWVTEGTNFAQSFNTVTPRKAGVEFSSTRTFAEFTSTQSPNSQVRLMATYMKFDHDHSDQALEMLDSAAAGVPGLLGPDQLLRTWLSKNGDRELANVRLENILKFDQRLGTAQLSHQVLLAVDYGTTESTMISTLQDHEIVDLNTRAAIPVWKYIAAFGLGTTKDGQIVFDNGNEHTKQRDMSAAIQDNIKVSDTTRVLLGLRYERNKSELVSQHDNYIFGATPAPVSTKINAEATKGRLLPRIGLLFKTDPQVSLFVNYLTSFIPAGGTQTGKTGIIAPETGDQFEAGAKFEMLGGRVFATASAFKIRREKIATFYTDPTTFASYWKATDSERSKGVELELTGAVARGFNVVGHIGYLDNEVTASDDARKLGRMRHGQSKLTTSLWGTYAFASPGLKGLRVGLGAFHSGRQWLEDYNTVEIAGRTVCDAMVAYGRDRWNVQVNVRNLFDKNYLMPSGNGYNDPAFSAATYNSSVQAVIPGAGIQAEVRAGYAF